MNLIILNLNFIISFAGFLLAIHILKSKPADKKASTLLGVAFFVLSIHPLFMNAIAVWGRHNIASIFVPTLALSWGPLFFLTFKRAAQKKVVLSYLHAFPAVLVFFMMATKQHWLNIDYLILASFFIYSVLLLLMANKGRNQFDHLNASKDRAFLWLISATVVLVLAFISELLIVYEINNGHSLQHSTTLLVATIFKLLTLTFVIFLALQNPSTFSWLSLFNLNNSKKFEDPEFIENLISVAQKFESLVAEKQLYLQENASLKTVSKQLSVTTRLLSESINHVFNQSFSKYMNVQRVKKAKKLLETSDVNITQLMFDSGFRTKSNFNKEFRALEGVSPSDYRATLKSKSKRVIDA